MTEIHDYLRLLYARVGVPHCPKCGREIAKQTVDQMVDQLLALPARTRMQLLAPVVRGKKGEHVKILENVVKQGFVRVRIDGEIYDAAEAPALAKQKKHNIEVVVDRLILREDIRTRLTDSLETALSLSGGVVIADIGPGEREMLFSQNLACPDCGISMEELSPRSFSFNSPFGACPTCAGLGMLQKIDPDLIVPDWGKSLNENPFNVMGWSSLEPGTQAGMFFQALSEKYGFSMDTPLNRLPKEALDVILYGSKGEPLNIHYTRPNGDSHTFSAPFEGVIPTTERRAAETQSDSTKAYYDGLMSQTPCPDCGGKRLRPEILAVTVGGKSIAEASDLSVLDAQAFFSALTFGEKDGMIAAPILKEIISRLRFLIDVGLGYLTLSRAAGTLSGGEAQRIRLATQIGSSLVGVLYILDEPSIGLHQRDNARLIETLKHLRDIGNTLIVVEHDEDTMLAADQIVDIGPGAGEHGGRLIAQGTAQEIMACPDSITGAYLSGRRSIPVPLHRKAPAGWLTVRGARANNLKNIDVKIPLGVMAVVTGVSGSGKSSLVNEIVYKTLQRDLNRAHTRPGACDGVEGMEQLDKVIAIDQSPIGRTPRSNPATYTGLFDMIRKVFAATPEAKARGYKENRFSFNVRGGRCEGLLRRRYSAHRDALSGGYLRALRGLQGQALQPRDARGALQGQIHRRRARYDRRGSAGLLLRLSAHHAQAANPLRRRAGLYPAGAVLHDALRRRGAARQAGDRAIPHIDRQDVLCPRRADDRPAHRRLRASGARAAPARPRRQLRADYRAQPRRHQGLRLRDRPRPRGRQRRRHARLRGHAGGNLPV